MSWWRALSSWWRLVALCVGANLAETALVMGFDHGTRPSLAPQVSAVAPFGVFHDLRWISVYHDSWAVFAGEVLAMLFLRGAMTAGSVALAWPQHMERPSTSGLISRGILSSAMAAVLLSPSVALLFALAEVPVSWLFIAAVPAAVLVALIVHPVAISGDWWRRGAALRAIGWTGLAFVVLTVSSAVMAAVPDPVWPLVSALAGLFNAWCWTGVVHAVVDRRPARRLLPVLPVALCVLIGVVIVGTTLGFSHARPPKAEAAHVGPAGRITRQPVLVVSGYGSTWDGRARRRVPGPFYEQQFSYRGLDSAGAPLPYLSADTVKSVTVLDRILLAQIDSLQRASGQKVDVVAESEGALVAKTALMADPAAPVATLVLASPLIAPGRVWYPTDGSEGWGVASSAGMKLLSKAFQSVSPIDLSPDSAFLSSIDRTGPVLEKAMTCNVKGVRQFALLPLADATSTPPGATLSFPSVVVPAFHGGLLENRSSERIVAEVLEHHAVSESQVLRFTEKAIRSAASAWQVPALVASDYPPGSPGASGSGPNCALVHKTLHDAVF